VTITQLYVSDARRMTCVGADGTVRQPRATPAVNTTSTIDRRREKSARLIRRNYERTSIDVRRASAGLCSAWRCLRPSRDQPTVPHYDTPGRPKSGSSHQQTHPDQGAQTHCGRARQPKGEVPSLDGALAPRNNGLRRSLFAGISVVVTGLLRGQLLGVTSQRECALSILLH
jgi:hypothetical protein